MIGSMHLAGAAVAAMFLSVALAGCSGTPNAARAPGEDSTTVSCPVTSPDDTPSRLGFNYGNDAIRVALWPDGRLIAGRLPDGSSHAEVGPDGSIDAKLGWWRASAGRLRIEGERLDATAPPLGADVPEGYGKGFQASGLIFPTAGCWRVVGAVGKSRLTFVVLVVTR
jgi:hypothetical protein